MRYIALMLGIPIVGSVAYVVHVVRLRRAADTPPVAGGPDPGAPPEA